MALRATIAVGVAVCALLFLSHRRGWVYWDALSISRWVSGGSGSMRYHK